MNKQIWNDITSHISTRKTNICVVLGTCIVQLNAPHRLNREYTVPLIFLSTQLNMHKYSVIHEYIFSSCPSPQYISITYMHSSALHRWSQFFFVIRHSSITPLCQPLNIKQIKTNYQNITIKQNILTTFLPNQTKPNL